jgi:hypothetical protein
MSDAGTIMDALITAAEGAVSGLTGAREIDGAHGILDENFPYLFVYAAHETVDVGDFQLETQKTRVEMLLFTKAETQEALLLKMDAIRDAIATDRTLGGVVQAAHVVERVLLEAGDTTVPTNSGYMVVETVEQTGKLISLVIDVEVELQAAYDDWGDNDNALEILVDVAMGVGTRLTSNLRADLDTIPVNATRYQLAWTISEQTEHGSNVNTFNAAIRVKVYHHMGPAADEETVLYGTLLPKIDSLLNPDTWGGANLVHHVLDGFPILSLDDVERV